MSFIVEIIITFVLDMVFSGIGETATEAGLNSVEKKLESHSISKILRGFTYAVVGILLGIISYFVFPTQVLHNQILRVIGIIISIISMGLMLCFVSWLMTRRESFWSTEKFIHGVVFGAAYSVTRALAVG